MGEAKEVREELAENSVQDVMGFGETGAGEMFVGPKGEIPMCFSFAKTSLAADPCRPLSCV